MSETIHTILSFLSKPIRPKRAPQGHWKNLAATMGGDPVLVRNCNQRNALVAAIRSQLWRGVTRRVEGGYHVWRVDR